MPRKGSATAGEGIGAWLRTLSQADLAALLERRRDMLQRPPRAGAAARRHRRRAFSTWHRWSRTWSRAPS